MSSLENIIPLPSGFKLRDKKIFGLINCHAECGEVMLVRKMKNGRIHANCDGLASVRRCGAGIEWDKGEQLPDQAFVVAKAKALETGLVDAPREYIELFNQAWNVNLSQLAQEKETNETVNQPEIPEIPSNTANNAEPDRAENAECPDGKSGTDTEYANSETRSSKTSEQPTESKSPSSGFFTTEPDPLFEEMYGG